MKFKPWYSSDRSGGWSYRKEGDGRGRPLPSPKVEVHPCASHRLAFRHQRVYRKSRRYHVRVGRNPLLPQGAASSGFRSSLPFLRARFLGLNADQEGAQFGGRHWFVDQWNAAVLNRLERFRGGVSGNNKAWNIVAELRLD